MQQSLFNNSEEKFKDDEGTLWFLSEKERDKEIEKIKKKVGTDKFGNLLNGQVPTVHYEDGKGFVKFGITNLKNYEKNRREKNLRKDY